MSQERPKFRGVNINLGGTDYTVPPLDLDSIEALEEQLSVMANAVEGQTTLTKQQLAAIVDIVHAAVSRN